MSIGYGRVVQPVESVVPYTECLLFDPQSGHILRLWFQSLLGVHTGGNRSMFLFHVNICLFLSPSVPPSLSKTN